MIYDIIVIIICHLLLRSFCTLISREYYCRIMRFSLAFDVFFFHHRKIFSGLQSHFFRFTLSEIDSRLRRQS